jgi:uncharacterized protein YbjT (DUF2867 family)
MHNIILFGGTGNLGKKIAEELQRKGYNTTAVARNQSKADEIKHLVSKYIIADVTNSERLKGICNGFDAVISSLGKSVSLNDKSKPSFTDIDLNANTNILTESIKAGIKKFVYVSALHADQLQHLEYFRVHHQFEEKLKASGIDYSIIRPPAIFSAFVDLIPMAQKGRLVNMGKGDKRTNPIYEGDLAAICVTALRQSNIIIEPGGKEVLTRKQINHIIQQAVDPTKKIRTIPIGMIKALLPLVKLTSKNTYDKMAFYTKSCSRM